MFKVLEPGTGRPSAVRTLLVCHCIKMVQIWANLALPIAENLRIMAHWLRWSADPVRWHTSCFNLRMTLIVCSPTVATNRDQKNKISSS